MTQAPASSALDVFVLHSLNEIGAPHVLVGGFAATLYGSNRATHDVDIVVSLREKHIQAPAHQFPPPRYYADLQQMRDSIARGLLLNIIDGEAGRKVDLLPVTVDPVYRQAFRRRVRVTIDDPNGQPMEIWVGRPDDVIIGKLKAWHDGNLQRHKYDIEAMLLLIYSGQDRQVAAWYHERRVDRQARALGGGTLQLWQQLKRVARERAGP